MYNREGPGKEGGRSVGAIEVGREGRLVGRGHRCCHCLLPFARGCSSTFETIIISPIHYLPIIFTGRKDEESFRHPPTPPLPAPPRPRPFLRLRWQDDFQPRATLLDLLVLYDMYLISDWRRSSEGSPFVVRSSTLVEVITVLLLFPLLPISSVPLILIMILFALDGSGGGGGGGALDLGSMLGSASELLSLTVL